MELAALTGTEDPEEGLRRLENGRTRVVAKLGANRAMALDGGRPVHVPAYAVQPIDTTGAGDSFNAGFLHRWLQGAPILECLRLGAACGALEHARPRRDRATAESSRTPRRSWLADDERPASPGRKALLGRTRRVSSVSLTADGARVLSGSLDRELRVWDVDGGVCGKVLVGETSDVNAVALSPDGRLAVSGSGEMTLKAGLARVWTWPPGRC